MEKILKVQEMAISQARSKITKLTKDFASQNSVVQITNNKRPVLALLDWELFDSIMETLEILADQELMAMLAKSRTQADEGQVLSWDEAKQILLGK